ncbi:MAG: Asp23/Gls24 family envelope stress response protein [Clostridia bacterium]|nr:Asp23/Gls24 family envelope stress response protein [Clostridia bacterium]
MAHKERYEQIIATLTATTVNHIEGVADISLDSGATFTGRIFRSQANSIQVTLLGAGEATIDISLRAYYGVNIPELAFTIQQAVKDKVEESTPYKVRHVNVNVVGVVFK